MPSKANGGKRPSVKKGSAKKNPKDAAPAAKAKAKAVPAPKAAAFDFWTKHKATALSKDINDSAPTPKTRTTWCMKKLTPVSGKKR